MDPGPERRQSLKEKLSLLHRQIESLQHEVEQTERSAPGPPLPAGGGAARLSELREAMQQILRAPSASTALNLLLSHAARRGERAVLFIRRQGAFWAWSGLGPGGERLPLSKLTLPVEESPTLGVALRTQQTRRAAGHEPWETQIGAPSAAGGVALPLVGAGGGGGVLWFDPGPASSEGSVESVECLVVATSAALELIALKRASALSAGSRMTTDDGALAAQLPYAVEDSGSGAGTVGAEPATPPVPGPDLGRQHEDARRLARLLVSEIKLYNEDKVVLGRKARDLYQRLREDIERSRQLYSERVSPEVRAATDYFRKELVTTLAGGDESLLGPLPADAA